MVEKEQAGSKLVRFGAIVGLLGAAAGAVATVSISSFNVGGAYRANQVTLDNINAHIASLEKNYDALNTLVQDDRQAGRQIISVQADVLRVQQNLQDMTKIIADLTLQINHIGDISARVDERVKLLDEIIMRVRGLNSRIGP